MKYVPALSLNGKKLHMSEWIYHTLSNKCTEHINFKMSLPFFENTV